MSLETYIGCEFRHFKGGRYRLLAVARHSETLEKLAVYQSMDEAGYVWVRPVPMFEEVICHEGKPIQRFTLVREEKQHDL